MLPDAIVLDTSSPTPYFQIVREERQVCAILTHLLLQAQANLRALLELIDKRVPGLGVLPESLDDAEIYFEYARLRDEWDRLGAGRSIAEANTPKREFIAQLIGCVSSLQAVAQMALPECVSAFNALFIGPRGERMRTAIASPAHWRLEALWKLAEQAAPGEEARTVFRSLCMLGWSFKIKPDLVIRVPGLPLLCIEAKLLSGEGQYPTGNADKRLFDEVFGPGKCRVQQVELQDFLFSVLLRERVRQVMISRASTLGARARRVDQLPVTSLSWREVFDRLDSGGSHPFVRRFLRENVHLDVRDPSNDRDISSGAVGSLAVLLALLDQRRQAGLSTEVGFDGGVSALQARTFESLTARRWKWREPIDSTAAKQSRNWLTAAEFQSEITAIRDAQTAADSG